MAEPAVHRPLPLPHLRPAVAVAWMVALVLLFGMLAADLVLHGPITRLDAPISAWFGNHLRPSTTQLMLAVSAMHQTVAICIVAALLAIGLLSARQRHWVPLLLAAVPGGLVLNAVVKLGFERARPAFDHPLVHLTTYSFPSGHAAGATVWWGFVLALWCTRERSAAARTAGAIVAVALVGITALSRVYLGAHYPSDVLAGIVEGTFWLLACFSGAQVVAHHGAGAMA
ncbi:phosphatase PAP2 family protein [Ramlibacter sp. MMS24-I3-19]|uniref:phosphatase PAP2 family protein n=1 Tax=Ramlibacter sp. MMS24-I3-19 TaxID=3416606 RepID=UPI003D02575C